MPQRYNEVCTDFRIESATPTREGEIDLWVIKAKEVIADTNPKAVAVSQFGLGPWTIPAHVTGNIQKDAIVRLVVYKGRQDPKKPGEVDWQFFWEVKGDKDGSWTGWNCNGDTYAEDGTKPTLAEIEASSKSPAPTPEDTRQIEDALDAATGLTTTPEDPLSNRHPLPDSQGGSNYSGGQSQDEFRRSKQEMRWTEAVHMAYVGAAEVDPDWTKIEANAHRIYAIIERGPQADILAQIEQDTQ